MSEQLNDLIQNIDEIINKINFHPEYSQKIRKSRTDHILKESIKHSNVMEHEENQKNSRNQFKIEYQNLQHAWEYLRKEGLTNLTFQMLGNKIDPIKNPKPIYRQHLCSFGGIYGAEHEKIPYLIDSLRYQIENNTEIHPIIKAIELHNRIVMIHPYEDGNGRTARLVSNLYLFQQAYVLYIIQKDERQEYIRYLNPVIKDRINGLSRMDIPSQSETAFNTYIAEKIFTSASLLEEHLKTRRTYNICFNSKENSKLIRNVKSRLKNYTNRQNKPISIKSKNDHIQVIGDLSRSEIHEFMNFYKRLNNDKYDFKYKTEIITK